MVYGCQSLLSNLSLAMLAMRDWELSFPSFAATWRLGIALVRGLAFYVNISLIHCNIQTLLWRHCHVSHTCLTNHGLQGLVYGYYFIHSSSLPPSNLIVSIPWALALLSNTRQVYALALAGQVLQWLFYSVIDRPYRASLSQKQSSVPIPDSHNNSEETEALLVGRLKSAAKDLVAQAKPRVSAIVRNTKSKVVGITRSYVFTSPCNAFVLKKVYGNTEASRNTRGT